MHRRAVVADHDPGMVDERHERLQVCAASKVDALFPGLFLPLSGLALPVGTKTRWRSESVAMTDHALAAPLRHPFGEVSEFNGMGSQLQRNAPERMSNARTTPAGSSTRPLSLIDDPTITRSSIRTGGEVM